MTCPMVALVSDAAHRAPDNPLRVSGSQQDRALSPIFAARTGARRFCRAPSIWICGTARSRRRQRRPIHRQRIQIRNLCQRMSRGPPSSAPCVGRTSGSEDSEGSWQSPVVIIVLLGGPKCARMTNLAWEDRPIPEVGLRLDDYFCLTSCFAARAAASM